MHLKAKLGMHAVVAVLFIAPLAAHAANKATQVQHLVVSVPAAKADWTPLPIELDSGDLLFFEVKGNVTLGDPLDPVGPEGRRDGNGALQIMVDTLAAPVAGRRGTLIDQSGAVQLRVQDSTYADNIGAYEIRLIRVPQKLIPPATRVTQKSAKRPSSTK